MTHDELPEDLARTEHRVRAALDAEALSVNEQDLSPLVASMPAAANRRRTVVLAAATAAIVLGGAITILSLAGRSGPGLANPGSSTGTTNSTPSASPAVVTVGGLPISSASCAFGTFKGYADEAVRSGNALVTGTLRLTGKKSLDEDGNLGWRSSQVEITIDSVLAGRTDSMELTGWVASGVVFLDPPPAPSSGAVSDPPGAASDPPGTGTAAPILDYEGNSGWATDGRFLGMLYRDRGDRIIVNPIPLIDDRAVVGLGCWSAGGLPSTRQRVDLVLSATPPVTISAPVDLVTVQDIRNSLH